MKRILILALFLIAFWGIFQGFQNRSVYEKTLGQITNNYRSEDGQKAWVQKPYEELTNENYVQWDGEHYYSIREHGYDVKKAGGDYIFAFFPLFPWIWDLTGSPSNALLLNYILLAVSIILLTDSLAPRGSRTLHLLIALSLPSVVIFFIPYSEATFLFMTTLGVRGFLKKSHWLFFTGFLLASLTRPAYTILALSVICSGIFFLPTERSPIPFIKRILYWLAPLLVGTAIVSLVQYTYGSGDPFKFLAVQDKWDNVLRVPHGLQDWSKEGFSINIGVITMVFMPLLTLLGIGFFDQLRSRIKGGKPASEYSPRNFLLVLSVIYLIGSSLFILLFRGGSLHCLFRFTLCSPFAFILLLTGWDKVKRIPQRSRWFYLGTLGAMGIFILGLAEYSTYWDFRDMGFFLLVLSIGHWLLQDHSHTKLYRATLAISIFLNLVWTSYLFNTYISNGWIFA